MATIVTDSKNYSDIAAAIRDKLGENKNFKPAEMAAAIEAIKTGAENVVEFTAPKGRMKGDVNGDGLITAADYQMAYDHYDGIANITDPVQFWCADVNGNGDIALSEINAINAYINGKAGILTRTPFMADYYGKWTYQKVDDFSGYFYYDVPVEGMTASSSALLLASAYSDCFIGVECMEGVARVKAERLPLAETDCLIVWEADGTKWEEADGGYKTVDVDIPLGRMRGDVDGDGVINLTDSTAISQHYSGTQVITDEVALWCADVDNNGKVNSGDSFEIQRYNNGFASVLTSTPTMADYYGNWLYMKVDNTFGYFYLDVFIEGVTTNSMAVLLVSGQIDCFDVPECFDGYIRIKALRCPTTALKGTILWKGYEKTKSEIARPYEKEHCTLAVTNNTDMEVFFRYQDALGSFAYDYVYPGGTQTYRAYWGTLVWFATEGLTFTLVNGTQFYNKSVVCITAKPGETCTITFS